MLDLIRTRRSVRRFTSREVPEALVEAILDAGRWAPSGKNNQPWRFAVIRESSLREALAGLTRYGVSVRQAQVLIALFLDTAASYDRTKDLQACGACLQNMLLAAHALDLGAVWLGEILARSGEVARMVEAPAQYELMAMLALGFPRADGRTTTARRCLEELVFFRK